MSKNFENYKTTYEYRILLEKHSLSEEGTWRVQGEDSNCDWGGHHHMPDLGYYTGRLEDIIALAVEMPSFWTWGAGGKISKISTQPVDKNSAKRRAELLKRKADLEKELAEVAGELEGK